MGRGASDSPKCFEIENIDKYIKVDPLVTAVWWAEVLLMLSDQNNFYTKSLIYSSSTTYVMGHIARLWWAEARAFPHDDLRAKILKLTRL